MTDYNKVVSEALRQWTAQQSLCRTEPTGMVVLTAQDYDIRRGYLIGPDGQEFLLSPKAKPGYQFTYMPTPEAACE